MDQVDKIIFQNFLSLGWDQEDVNSLQELEVSEIAKLMVKCLYAINADCDLPQSLPHNMSQRFRVAARIAETIKELGYKGDLGYQSILYSNEADLRKIFTFLIEKLPKDAPTLSREPMGKSALIKREASRKLNEALQRPWVPVHCLAVARRYRTTSSDDVSIFGHGVSHCHCFSSARNHCLHLSSQSFSEYLDKPDDDYSMIEVSPSQLLPTLLHSHAEQVGKVLSSSEEFVEDPCVVDHLDKMDPTLKYEDTKRTSLSEAFEDAFSDSSQYKVAVSDDSRVQSGISTMSQKEITAEEGLGDRPDTKDDEDQEEKLTLMASQISALEEEVLNLSQLCTRKEDSLSCLRQTVDENKAKIEDEDKKLSLLRKTSSLTADPEGNIIKLKNSLESSKEREEKLMRQWMEYRLPLQQELDEAKMKLEDKKSEMTKIESEISALKKTSQHLIEEAKQKENLLLQLREQKNKITKGTNRSVYTKQILDVSAKVRKQKQEVEKILRDTRPVQKEINNLTGKLQRTFAVVEDTSFKAASANERARPIYRSVVTIHDTFGALVDIVRETGCIQREIADLQQQLNSEKSKNIEDNLKKLEEDYQNVKAENVALQLKINSQP